jgi:hypothetical protein
MPFPQPFCTKYFLELYVGMRLLSYQGNKIVENVQIPHYSEQRATEKSVTKEGWKGTITFCMGMLYDPRECIFFSKSSLHAVLNKSSEKCKRLIPYWKHYKAVEYLCWACCGSSFCISLSFLSVPWASKVQKGFVSVFNSFKIKTVTLQEKRRGGKVA